VTLGDRGLTLIQQLYCYEQRLFVYHVQHYIIIKTVIA